jgi:nicotinamide-nucleotide amidase
MTAGRTTRDPKRDALREAALVHGLLRERRETVATAESLTGGRLGMLLTETPCSSDTYVGGVVAYATRVKVELLGVPASLVEAHGVVSVECARAMAQAVRDLTGASFGVSTTGVAGPDPQEGKRAGTVFVGVTGPDDESVVALELSGSRFQIRDRTCAEALSALAAILHGKKPALG